MNQNVLLSSNDPLNASVDRLGTTAAAVLV